MASTFSGLSAAARAGTALAFEIEVMNAKLLGSCLVTWILGLAGMFLSRVLLHLGPGAVPFQISTSLWIAGGLGYAVIGLTQLCSGPRLRHVEADSMPRRRVVAPADDLSALIRKR